MPARLVLAVSNWSPRARRRLFGWLFDTLAAMTRDVDGWTFMNYGYAALDGRALLPGLDVRDEAERYCAQLYHHALAGIDLRGRDVVEVSSGRGGGAAYIARYLNPAGVTGIDLSAEQVAFCRRVHRHECLAFREGAAEDLPLADASADVVVNIEASCVYADIDAFFAEVVRVLRPGGHFVYVDFHLAKDVERLRRSLANTGMRTVAFEDITANVAAALKADHRRRLAALRRHAPFLLHWPLKAFAGTQGTVVPNSLASGRMVYLKFVLVRDAQA